VFASQCYAVPAEAQPLRAMPEHFASIGADGTTSTKAEDLVDVKQSSKLKERAVAAGGVLTEQIYMTIMVI
jgi:hypothetical protein